ncbi:MAG: hypothetical protein KFF49_09175 [Bacteroidales bacterium]|nr:hypothetical protein [Bacteroidales bacterium]
MKRLTVILFSFIFVGVLNAQNLDRVIEKHLEAINFDKLSKFNSLIIKGHINLQGMKLDMEMYQKGPDKIKSVSIISGMEMVQVINGDRGYMINPMMGSSEPVLLTSDQIASIKKGSMLSDHLLRDYGAGHMEMDGEEEVAGRPAYKIKIMAPEGTRYIFIDKELYYITQMRMRVEQMGMEVTLEMRMRDFSVTDGITMARAVDTFMDGQPAGTAVYKSIEFNRNIDDSVFEIK